jgi:dipeptidyl aminopeptidase/acylaminoacyl peptidase
VPAVAPYGAWASPISPEALVEQAVRLLGVEADGERIIWSESRPAEAGRQVLVSGHDLLAPPLSARTLVHEYGGRCYASRDGVVVFSNHADQRLWLIDGAAEARPLTAEAPAPRAVRFADPVITPDGSWVVCVRETHGADVVNELVTVDLGTGEVLALAGGHDFFSAPRLSPHGQRLAWLSWDHPDMPWDHTELWEAELRDGKLGEASRLAGETGESITQPRFSPGGRLHYISDRSGWWNIYDEEGRALAPVPVDFSGPDWGFGQSTFTFLPDGRLVATWWTPAGQRLGLVEESTVRPLDLPFTTYESLQGVGGGVAAIAASPLEAAAVVRIDIDSGAVDVLRRSSGAGTDPGYFSVPRPIEFPTGQGVTAHALFYPPANRDFEGPAGTRPPLIVVGHGGPTDRASSALNLKLQFWTSRGFAVVDVDYRGSTGYGREYRDMLRGGWGVVDVEDCVNAARWLAGRGEVDAERLVIRGGSAGGFTALCAVAFHDLFAVAASHYGVADLELLARDTPKFESRYFDGLVGPYPDAVEEYRRRSPIHAAERINCPVIFFQGLDDVIVPPTQSEALVDALQRRGIQVAYLTFAGEQHGFRQASTIVRVAEAELSFYGDVLGFAPG